MCFVKDRGLILERIIRRNADERPGMGHFYLGIRRNHVMASLTDQNTMVAVFNIDMMILTQSIERKKGNHHNKQ